MTKSRHAITYIIDGYADGVLSLRVGKRGEALRPARVRADIEPGALDGLAGRSFDGTCRCDSASDVHALIAQVAEAALAAPEAEEERSGGEGTPLDALDEEASERLGLPGGGQHAMTRSARA